MIMFFYDASYTDDHLLAVISLMIHILTIVALIKFRMSLKDVNKSQFIINIKIIFLQ